MEMIGEQRIPQPREVVWRALNDPDILCRCIPGCESLARTGENAFDAVVAAKVGPVRARFSGSVLLSDIDPPSGYTLTGEGKGGTAGFAKGRAAVTLADDGGLTVLSYRVHADVGGKLAQLGARLIDGAAKKLANEFFANLTETLIQDAVEGSTQVREVDDAKPVSATGVALQPWVWAGGLILAVILLLVYFGA